MPTIEEVIAQTIREQWALGADRTVMTVMVQNAVRDAINAECVPCLAETAPHTCLWPEPTVALVAVNEMGQLTPESTVTVGESSWPVPERTEGFGVYAPARLAEALAQRGYRRVVGGENVMDGDGFCRVPVKPIETTES